MGPSFFHRSMVQTKHNPLAIHRDQGVTYDSESPPCLNLILSTDLRLLRKTIFGWDRPRGYSCLETLFCACHPLAILRGWGLNAAFSHLWAGLEHDLVWHPAEIWFCAAALIRINKFACFPFTPLPYFFGVLPSTKWTADGLKLWCAPRSSQREHWAEGRSRRISITEPVLKAAILLQSVRKVCPLVHGTRSFLSGYIVLYVPEIVKDFLQNS